ncbi:MAG TPA: acyltransferase, partial [candidate division WOR-3 bacterium]|nr:acyltransferase [candidate division WOR-3 bacterium]
MRIGFLQFAPIFGNKEKNLELLVNTLKKTNPLPEVLVLPELAFTGYTFINKKEAVLLSE